MPSPRDNQQAANKLHPALFLPPPNTCVLCPYMSHDVTYRGGASAKFPCTASCNVPNSSCHD